MAEFPTIEEIRAGAKATLEDALPGLTVYASGEAVQSLPAAVLAPETADFDVAMRGAVDSWEFSLVVMVPTGELAHGQLDAYVSGGGPDSIRQAVFARRDLGLGPNVAAHVSALTSYNVALSVVEVDHVAAVLRVNVETKVK